MAIAKPLHLRLFIEGIEVPVVSAQVSVAFNGPASAAIQVVPLDEVLQLHPRSMVHLFFLDHLTPGKPTTLADSYKLLFSGESIGFSFVQTPMSRAVVLQCLDFSSYWDAAHATAIEYGPNGNLFSNQAALYGSNSSLFDDLVSQQPEKLAQWLRQSPRTPGLKKVSGLAGGVIRLLENVGGVPGHFKGINDFFTVAELRCRVMQQLTAEEKDDTASRLLSAKVQDQFVRTGLQNAGQQVTFRDLMNLLFSYIHYECVPNPAPKYDPPEGGRQVATTAPSSLGMQVAAGLQDVIDDLFAAGGHADKVREAAKSPPQEVATRHVRTLEQARKTLGSLGAKARSAANEVQKALVALEKVAQGEKMFLATDIETPLTPHPVVRPTEQGPTLGYINEAIDRCRSAQTLLAGTSLSTKKGSATVGASSERLHSQIIRPDCWFAVPPRCNVLFPEHYTQLAYDRVFLGETTRYLVMTYNTLVGSTPELPQMAMSSVLAPNIGPEAKTLSYSVGKQGYTDLMGHELHTGIVPRSQWIGNAGAINAKMSDRDREGFRKERIGWAKNVALFGFFKQRYGPRTLSVGGRFNPYLVAGFPALVIRRPFLIPEFSKKEDALGADTLSLVRRNASFFDAPSHFVGMVAGLTHNVDQSGGTTSVSMNHVRLHSGADDEFMRFLIEDKGKRKKRIKVVLRAQDVKDDLKLLSLLTRATPQSSEPKKAKNVRTRRVERQVKVRRKSFVQGQVVEREDVVSAWARGEEELVAETPTLTQTGHIRGLERAVQVPSPQGRLSAGDSGVYGQVVGIEVLDATLVDVAGLRRFTDRAVRGWQDAGAGGRLERVGSADVVRQDWGDVGARRTQQPVVNLETTEGFNGQAYACIVLHEELEVPFSATRPIEDILLPGFFADAYRGTNIGRDIYQRFFGVGSIVDDLLGDLKLEGVGAETGQEGPVVDPDRSKDALIAELAKNEKATGRASIEHAGNFLAYLYGVVKAQGKDVDDFVQSYTARPIATLTQMLGSEDLELQVSGSKLKATQGKLGFHSHAIHPRAVNAPPLTGLVEDASVGLQRVQGSKEMRQVLARYDVRRAKRDRVMAYVAALRKGPGLLG